MPEGQKRPPMPSIPPSTPPRGSATPADWPALFSPIGKHSTPFEPVIETGNTNVDSPGGQELAPIRVINFDNFKRLTSFPRFPDNSDIAEDLNNVDPNVTLFIFISHCWMRGWSGALGWDGRPHPDDAKHSKFALVVEAVEKIMAIFAPGMSQCYLWLDFGCIDQNEDPAAELKQLLRIVQMSDCMLTTLVDEDFAEWSLLQKAEQDSWFSDYLAPAWQLGDHSYLQRAWCRMEMFYAANVPLPDLSKDPYFSRWRTDRRGKFAMGLETAIAANRRPHLLYGSRESAWHNAPIVLPPLQNSYLDLYSPAQGKLTMQNDRPKIEALMAELAPYIAKVEVGYTGSRNVLGQMHGEGTMVYEDGSSYRGGFVNDCQQGQGTFEWPNGDLYTGSWMDDKKHGHGEYREAAGGSYVGEWEDDDYHGEGKYMYAIEPITGVRRVYQGSYVKGRREGHGSMIYNPHMQYVGEWKAGKENGKGLLRWENGDMFEGLFFEGHRVAGRLVCVDGNVYEGEWLDDKKHGQGREVYPNGARYVGTFLYSKRHGSGMTTNADGSIYDGEYVSGERYGYGRSIRADGSGYEGMYVRDMRHGQGCEYGPGHVLLWQGMWHEGGRTYDVAEETSRLTL